MKLVCGINCHHKCQRHMPNLCGVNQKQLSDALYEIKRGSLHNGAPNLSALNLGSSASGHSFDATRAASQSNLPQNGGVGNKFKAFFRNSQNNFEAGDSDE